MKKLCVRSSESPQFKIDNIEYLLHKGSYHIIQLDKDLTVVQLSTHGALVSVLQVIKHLHNARIVCIIGSPTTSKYNQLFRDHLGVKADKTIVNKYWAYIGVKKSGHLEVLRYKFDTDTVEFQVGSNEILVKTVESGASSEMTTTITMASAGPRTILITRGVPIVVKVEPNKYFDHIYLINMQKEPFKLLKMTYVMRELNLDFTAVEAYDTNFDLVDYNQPIKQVGQKQVIAKILEDATKRDYDSILILTDNILINRNFVKLTSQILAAPVCWDAIFMANSHKYKDLLIPSHKLHIPSWKAVALNRKGIRELKLVIAPETTTTMVDVVNELVNNKTIQCYTPRDHLISSPNAHLKSTTRMVMPAIPSVDVVINVCNDQDTISMCIHTLLQQDYAGKVRYVFVNNSSDNAVNLIKRCMGSHEYTLIDGDAECTHDSDYIVDIDAKCLLPYTYISRALLLMNTEYIDCISPAVIVINHKLENNITSKLHIKESPMFLSAAAPATALSYYTIYARDTSAYPTTMIGLPLYLAL